MSNHRSINLSRQTQLSHIVDHNKSALFARSRRYGSLSTTKDAFSSKSDQRKDQISPDSNDELRWKDLGFIKKSLREPDSPGRVRHRRRRPTKEYSFDINTPHAFPPSTWHYFRKKRRQQKFLKEVNSMKEVRVQSIHVSQTIDLVAALSKVFKKHKNFMAVKHHFGKNCLIVQLPSEGHNTANFGEDVVSRFVAIFRFGSVVFFHVSDNDRKFILKNIKGLTSSTSPSSNTHKVMMGLERREFFQIVIQPSIGQVQPQQEEVVQQDYVVIDALNIDSVAVISTIMAQTVALDTYSDIVDGLLSNFDKINSSVKDTGTFSAMDREALFKAIAQNNSIFIDMMSKLGIKERSDFAWNLTQYEQLHEGLREEFEINDRFDQIELKLNMIQQNAKFFLDMIHNQKSNILEWVIIVLILFECILMIMEMSGFGEKVFAYVNGEIVTDLGITSQLLDDSNVDANHLNNENCKGKSLHRMQSNLAK